MVRTARNGFSRGAMARGAVAAIAVLALAGACGGGGSKKAAAIVTTLPLVTTTTLPPPVVVTKTDPKLGVILADATGMTLYTLTKNKIGVACDAACVAVWPQLDLPPGGMLPTGGAGVGQLGVAPGVNGTLVVTHDGLNLYKFSKDTSPVDAKGEGVSSFGGTWHVVKVGDVTTTSSSTSTTVKSTSTTATTEETASTEPASSIEPTSTPDTLSGGEGEG